MAIALSALATPVGIEGGVRIVTALMVPVLSAIDIAAAYIHRSELNWPAVLTIVPTTCIGMAAGNMVAEQLTDGVGKIAVGSILIALLALQTVPAIFARARATDSPRQLLKATIVDGPPTGMELHPGHSNPGVAAARSSNQPRMLSAAAIATGLFGGCATVLTNSMVARTHSSFKLLLESFRVSLATAHAAVGHTVALLFARVRGIFMTPYTCVVYIPSTDQLLERSAHTRVRSSTCTCSAWDCHPPSTLGHERCSFVS